MTLNVPDFIQIDLDPAAIISRRVAGLIYSSDFRSGEGKYISAVIDSEEPVDAVLQISSRIELRITYILKDEKVSGVQISKVNGSKTVDKINLSTLDLEGLAKLLQVFTSIDVSSVATGSIILDSSIIGDKEKLEKFLSTIATDPEGRKKFEEVASNFGLLKVGEIDLIAEKKTKLNIMEKFLDDKSYFQKIKIDNKIGKDEEVWQRFFVANNWLLGTDVVEILDDRRIDEDSIVDLPVKSLDGFVDIIELKLPDEDLWTKENYPTSALSKAVMQCARYLTEYERRFNDLKARKKLGADILKPRITLIIGKTTNWSPEMSEQLRVYNSLFHNITILTYDHVLQRGKNLLSQTKGCVK